MRLYSPDVELSLAIRSGCVDTLSRYTCVDYKGSFVPESYLSKLSFRLVQRCT